MSDSNLGLPSRMAFSAVAGMGAACFCHPLDVLRVQKQVDAQKRPLLQLARDLVRKHGLGAGLYPGLTAAFLRQWTYGSCRMGIFSFLLSRHRREHDGAQPGLARKLGFGMISGGIGALAGTPSEVALVRMGADTKLPPAEQRHYKGLVDCLSRIFREEGLAGMWNGGTVTVMRAMIMGSCQMGVYAQAKQELVGRGLDPAGLPVMLVSATAASFVANGACMPFDVVKSRLQSQNPVSPAYSGMLDCATKSIAAEGPLVLWKGFVPAFVKLAPYTILSLTFLEKLTLLATGSSAL